MCVIVFKPAGAECPTMDVLESCWTANPDGAGIAVSEKSSVFMRKGFMKFSELANFCTENKVAGRVGQAIMFHFRIGTHGLKDAGNTHPFPISADPATLRQLTGRHAEVVAHNGVFSNVVTLPEVSDTGQFMADCAGEGGDPVDYWNKHPTIRGWSRLFIMRPRNRYILLGDWHCSADSPCMFSNLNWKVKKYVAPTGADCGFYEGGGYGGYGYGDGYGKSVDYEDFCDRQGGEARAKGWWHGHKKTGQDIKRMTAVVTNGGGLATAWVGGVGIRRLKCETYMEWHRRVVFAEEALAVSKSRAAADKAVESAEKKSAADVEAFQSGVSATIAAAKAVFATDKKAVVNVTSAKGEVDNGSHQDKQP
jgi:hypothetical protein